MGSKNSVKSKSQHLVVDCMHIFKGVVVQWQGNGVYIHTSTDTYCRVTDMEKLERAMRGQYGKTPVYIAEEDLSDR